MPSRSASSSIALATNSRPITAASRCSSASANSSPAGSARNTARPSTRRGEGELGPGQRQPAHHLLGGLGLGPLGAQELEPRRHLEEQVAHLDPGADCPPGAGAGAPASPPVDARAPRPRSSPAVRLVSRSRLTERDRGQRLAAKAQRGDPRAAARRRAWRWRGAPAPAAAPPAPCRSRRRVTWISAVPPASSATSIRVGAGVDRVLDQLLDHRRRPLDHLAGGDAVGDGLGQAADRGHGPVLPGAACEAKAAALPRGARCHQRTSPMAAAAGPRSAGASRSGSRSASWASHAQR